MKNLGYQISEDGATQWRNNGGCIERKFHFVANPQWENVSGHGTPTTAAELRALCKAGNFEYSSKKPTTR